MPDSATYDTFLSHSHQDAEIVEALAKRLEDETGLRVWLDKWVLVSGSPWRQATYVHSSLNAYAFSFVIGTLSGTPPGGYFPLAFDFPNGRDI